MKRNVRASLAMAVLAAACLVSSALAGHGEKKAAAFDEGALPAAQRDNYRVFSRACSGCHKPAKVLHSPVATVREWEKIVDRMVSMHGARLSKDDRTRILAFLTYLCETSRKARSTASTPGS
ncbi:MAG: hypothetical protein HY320_05500 [Armatimonadetes bacterium]|nr:hypothetical protein [Armatimonadota bacterium]